MKLSCSIMAHPVRQKFVGELLGSLDRVVPISWDYEGKNRRPSKDPERRWRNGKAAWEMFDPSSDWHMVIQDDALVVPDLLAGMEKILEHVPEKTIVEPYVGMTNHYQSRVARLTKKADRLHASWISMAVLMWGVAIAVPTSEIPDMLEWCDEQKGRAYDSRISLYFKQERNWQALYTWPSLVDHRDAPSICGHGTRGRKAYRMHQGSALEFDPTGRVAGGVSL